MIIEATFYAVQCDNCKSISEGYDGMAYWSESSYSEENAMEGEWHKEEDKHYCPDCFSFNDEDELVIKVKYMNREKLIK